MSVTKSYPRPKSATTNSTGIVLTASSSEGGELTPYAHLGNDGIIETVFQADANESGGTDVQDIARIETTPILGTDGKLTFRVTFIPVKGGGADGSPQSFTFTHDEDMDAWQTAAGRARQS